MSKILQVFKCRHLAVSIVLMAVSGGLLVWPASVRAHVLTPVWPSEASEVKTSGAVPTGHHEKCSVLVYLEPGADRGPLRAFAKKKVAKIQYEYKVVMRNVVNLRNIPVTALSGLQNIPGVVKVEEDRYCAKVINLHNSTPLIGGLQSQITNEGYSADGAGVRVCICDTGIDSDHLMYSDRIDTSAGYDFYNDDSNPEDDHGHGSHVAGIAVGGTGLSVDFGCGDGSQIFQGVAPKATLIGVKILNRYGGGYDSDIIAGIDYCADQSPSGGRADIINLSIGTGQFSGPCDHIWADAANNAVANGVVVVAASGNENNDNALCSPACGGDVIAVGMTWKADYPTCEDYITDWNWGICTDYSPQADDLGCFSNESDYLDVVAPGANIWSASIAPGGSSITGKSGTSMASPQVAGLAALILSINPSLTPAEVRQIIRDGAIDFGPEGFDRGYGYGRISVLNSLALAVAQCNSNEDCDDSDNCTTDVCSDGVCSYTPFSCPEEGEECMDGICVPHVCDNNGVCESGEDCNNCPNDCFEGSSAVCGNGVCETSDGEDCQSCPDDCNGILTGKPSHRYCCGSSGQYGSTCADGRCTGSGNTCSSDPAVSTCCGDGVCEGAEDLGNCHVDCACTGSENCDDGNECTDDSCVDGACQNSSVLENTSCNGGLCCSGACKQVVCSGDGDCDDKDPCTNDICENPNTCNASCLYTLRDDSACQEECSSSGASCTQDSDCCSDKCLGKPGSKTCK